MNDKKFKMVTREQREQIRNAEKRRARKSYKKLSKEAKIDEEMRAKFIVECGSKYINELKLNYKKDYRKILNRVKKAYANNDLFIEYKDKEIPYAHAKYTCNVLKALKD